MIQFWNYNKSGIHSFCGAKMVEITFDEKCILAGELAKASGSLLDATQRVEPILFTSSEVRKLKSSQNTFPNFFSGN
jgi:hypothetical protein